MRIIILALLCILCPILHAQPDRGDPPEHAPAEIAGEDPFWSLGNLRLRDAIVYWENDGTVPNFVDDTDRFYTNGLGVELSFEPNFTDDIASRLAPPGEWTDPRFGIGLALKQLIFTGVDITDRTPPTDDHPYGGYLYVAFSLQRADAHKHDHFELDLGVIGERAQAEAVQRFIHKTFPDEEDPQGWATQLANEAAVNFTYERTWKSERAEIGGVELEMLPALGFDLGNVSTRAKGRLTLRGGLNLPDDFGPATLLGHKDHTISANDWGEGDFSFYLYATLGIDAVARDIFLDGNTFASSRSIDSEPFVAEASFGFVTRFHRFYLGWAQHFQTETFEAQNEGQTWGTLALGASFVF